MLILNLMYVEIYIDIINNYLQTKLQTEKNKANES